MTPSQAQYEQLRAKLQVSFAIHGWRLQFISAFLLALIQVRTVSFTRLGVVLSGRNKSSNVRRIQRFMSEFCLDFDQIACFLRHLLPVQPPYTLCLDRTNWQFAGINYNILCLSVAADGVAIPLLWMFLDKKGNSDQQERICLLQRYLRLFGKDTIRQLVADREFIGQHWIGFLQQQRIPFCLRVRENMHLTTRKGAQASLRRLFEDLPLNRIRFLEYPVKISGEWVYVSGLKIKDNPNKTVEYLITICHAFNLDSIKDYARRWGIECLFKSLKSAGFQIEKSQLKDLQRFEKLFALVCIAFVWAYLVGQYEHQQKNIPILSHQRKAESIFRHGLDKMTNAFLFDNQQFNQYIQFLSYT